MTLTVSAKSSKTWWAAIFEYDPDKTWGRQTNLERNVSGNSKIGSQIVHHLRLGFGHSFRDISNLNNESTVGQSQVSITATYHKQIQSGFTAARAIYSQCRGHRAAADIYMSVIHRLGAEHEPGPSHC
jgi:hypothetical protein